MDPSGNFPPLQCMRTAVAAARRLLFRPTRELAPARDVPELPGPAAALLLHLLEAVMPPSVLAEAAAPAHATSMTCTEGSSGSQAAAVQRPKSAKRRASEAALERRFSSSDLVAAAAAAAGSDPAAKRLREERPAVRVAACSDCCSGRAEVDAEGAEGAAAWCAQDVALPPMDWAAALQAVQHDADMAYDRAADCYLLPGEAWQGSARCSTCMEHA